MLSEFTHFRPAFAAAVYYPIQLEVMNSAAEMKRKKEQFLHEMYTLAKGRLGILIDTHDLGEKYKLGWEKLETIIDYLEVKGFIASYEGTLYASITLKGVEYVESRS